jgi:hypothetical protein
LYAFVRRGNQEIDASRGKIQRNCAAAAHGVNDVTGACAFRRADFS